jgi:iron complex transport system substrate-binding protein
MTRPSRPAVRRPPICVALLLSVFAIAVAGAQDRPARIVSLVPAVTEMLFAIGAGPQVVAVSSFDDYPPQVRNLERVGALLDPDLERMLALKPDLVVVYATQTDLQRQLQRARVDTYSYKHAGLADIPATIRDLGSRTGHAAEAGRAAAAINSGIDDLRLRTAGRPRPRTLLVIGREPLAIRGVYASGGVGFLHDMPAAAGGENIFAEVRRQSVQASSELILSRRPEVIIELRAGEIPEEQRRKEIESWERLTALPAVRSDRVHFITDPRTVIPGPRVAEGAEIIARMLHPELFK